MARADSCTGKVSELGARGPGTLPSMSNPATPGGTNPPPHGTPSPAPGTPPRVTPPPITGTVRPRVPVGTQPRPETDLATRLDGQRGWLNELDRSLKKRSIIALVLTCLAVGAAAAAIYISVTKNSDAERIDALETRIEAIEAVGAAGGIAPSTTTPETLLPEAEVTDPSTTLPEDGVTGDTGTTVDPATPLP